MSDTPSLTFIVDLFVQAYGTRPAAIARAPGRVEFVGNHTDYNGGAVLGAAIDRYVWVAAAPNPAGRLRLISASSQAVLELPADPSMRITGSDAWANYPLGVWRSLQDFSLPRPTGFALLVGSNLPGGAGLSSSAVLEFSIDLALLAVAGKTDLAPDRLAALGRHAEKQYVGVPCGILDQGTSAIGRSGHLVQIDYRGPAFPRVPFPTSAHLWVFDPREKHALIDGLYAARYRECLTAANALGVSHLAERTPDQLPLLESRLTPIAAKHTRHIVAEPACVREAVPASLTADLGMCDRLLTASPLSSQHPIENSTPAFDQLVDLLEPPATVHGARLTGGDFGGAVVALPRADFTDGDAAEVAARYAAQHGRPTRSPIRRSPTARTYSSNRKQTELNATPLDR
jgi:galactokinase